MIKPVPGVDDPSSFRWMMVGLGILAGLIVYFSTFFYKEKTFQQAEEQLPFFKAFVESFKNVPFIIFLVSSFTVIYCQTGLMQGVFYYFDNVPGVNAMYTYIALGVGIVAGVFFWVNMRERWGVKRCLQIWLFVFSLGCFIMLLMGKTQIGAILSFLCVGVGFAGGMYLIPIMNGDVIDYDETRTKLRREGMYAGINSFVSKPAISLAQAAFLSITASYGYVAGQPTPPEMMDQVSTGILTGWMLIPGILLAVSFVSMFFYPLFGKKWEQTKKELGMLHEKKERALLAKQVK